MFLLFSPLPTGWPMRVVTCQKQKKQQRQPLSYNVIICLHETSPTTRTHKHTYLTPLMHTHSPPCFLFDLDHPTPLHNSSNIVERQETASNAPR